MTTDVNKLQEMLSEALEAGQEAQLMCNLLLAAGAKLGPMAMIQYNKLHKSCAARTRKLNQFTHEQDRNQH